VRRWIVVSVLFHPCEGVRSRPKIGAIPKQAECGPRMVHAPKLVFWWSKAYSEEFRTKPALLQFLKRQSKNATSRKARNMR